MQSLTGFSLNQIPRVLHVDDNPDFVVLFSVSFSYYLEITHATSGAEALKLLRSRDFDIVVTDYEMSPMDGLELLQNIKMEFPHMPVIFYTGQGNEEIAREAFISGVDDYFVKNFNEFAHKEKLVNSIKVALEKNTPGKLYVPASENSEKSSIIVMMAFVFQRLLILNWGILSS